MLVWNLCQPSTALFVRASSPCKNHTIFQLIGIVELSYFDLEVNDKYQVLCYSDAGTCIILLKQSTTSCPGFEHLYDWMKRLKLV